MKQSAMSSNWSRIYDRREIIRLKSQLNACLPTKLHGTQKAVVLGYSLNFFCCLFWKPDTRVLLLNSTMGSSHSVRPSFESSES